MKKLLIMLLVVAMLLPVGICAQAETQQAEVKPFVMTNMGGTDDEFYDYIYSQPCTYTYKMNASTTQARVSFRGTENIQEMAAKMKEDFDARPEGARYFQYDTVNVAFHDKAELVVYFDTSVEITKTWLDTFLAEYKRIGGKLDGVVVDLEYIESHAYYLKDYYTGTRNKTQNKNIYADIVNDPRYATRIRPLLVDMGFEFYPNPSGEKSEIWTIYSGDKSSYKGTSYIIWNTVLDRIEREAINESVLDVVLKYYPEAGVSDYQSGTYAAWEKCLDNHGSIRTYNLTSAGNVANNNAYCGRPEGSYFNSGKQTTNNPPSYNKAIYEASPFTTARFEVNQMKSIQASTETGRFDVWFANYEYGRYEDGKIIDSGYRDVYSGTPYYTELIYHIGLLNPEAIYGFIVGTKLNRDGFYMCDSLPITNAILEELSRVAGYADRKAIKTEAGWNGDYMLTGMYSGGRNIWRITPDTTVISVEDFKVKDRAPTFSVNGVTITFPQGRIIEDNQIPQAGSCGYWVETPTGVNPVITATSTRYKDDPSLWVDFEEYTAGEAFTKALGLPKNCWEVTGSSKIETGATGNALALSGASTVSCVTLPKNITAGDEYAKQQIWEVDVTLPSGFSGDVWVLKCTDSDNGVKISGGKVYYDEKGKLKELPGVNLAAGTYTIRREVDFRAGNAFTSGYTIYDASGNILGEAKGVAMSSFELPVTRIAFSTGTVNKAVELDNFKMYPTGTTTVLELYDTKYGAELKDITVSRIEDTGYRMTWMNASSEYKVAYIYDGMTGNVLKKINMTPGMDGIVTGVVKPDGKAVTIAVEVQTVSAPETPNYDEGYFDWEPYGSSADPSTDGGNADNGNNGDGNNGDGEENLGTLPPEILETLPGWTDATDPNQGADSTGGNNFAKKMDPGLIVLIICLSIFILGGGGFVLYWYVIKPKLEGKPKQKKLTQTQKPENQENPNVEKDSDEVDFSAETQIIHIEETDAE